MSKPLKCAKITLLVISFLGLSPVAIANWQTDCGSLQNVQNPCAPIQNELGNLNTFMPPAPFLSTTINQFPASVFPQGSPFTNSSAGGGGSTSEVLPNSNSSGSSSGSSPSAAPSSTFQ